MWGRIIYFSVGIALLGAFAHNSTTARAAISESNKFALAEALNLYQTGKYSETLKALDKIRGDRETQATVDYWRGLCEFQRKEYSSAIRWLEQAKRDGNSSEDIDYVLGQSYYASQKLQEATTAFLASAKRNYKQGASLYYLGYIQQILEKDITADKIYSKVGRLKQDPDNVKQAALFQRAEIRFGRAQAIKDQQKRAAALKKHVLPVYEMARDYADDTPTSEEAELKVSEVKSQIEKAEPPRLFQHRATIEFAYDSNVISKADESTLSISDKDSFVFKPTLRSTFNRPISEKLAWGGGLRLAPKLHTRRSTPDVYKNDNITIEPNLSLDWDHLLAAKKATTTFNFEFNYQLQDWQRKHSLPYYSRSYNFEVNERADIFATGDSTLKGNLKFYENYNPGLNSIQPGLDLGQRFTLGPGKLSAKFSVDWLNSRTPTDSTVTYKIALRYPFDLDPSWNVTPKFSWSWLDPKRQKVTRGIEKKINPGISVRKTLKNGMILRLSYDFTRNLSLDRVNQQYKRHEVTGAFEFRF